MERDVTRMYALCILLFWMCTEANAQCTFPMANGTWLTSSRGTWTVSDNQSDIYYFEGTMFPTTFSYDLECIDKTGDQYIIGTKTAYVLFGVSIFSYTCMEIRSTSFSPNVYEFYFLPDTDIGSGEPFQVNQSGICDNAVNTTTGKAGFIVLAGTSEESVALTLPNVIRGDYSVMLTDQNGVTGNETVLGSCNDTRAFYFSEVENATKHVPPVGFSNSGVLYALKYFTSGDVTYIYTFNNDTTVDSVTTYQFACWAISQDSNSSTVYATVYPEICQDDQTATDVPSGGQKLVLVPFASAADVGTTALEAWQIVLIVLSGLILVALIVLTVFLVRKYQARDKSKPIPENVDSTKKKGLKGKRPKSSSDIDSARLLNEKKKKKLAKQKPTRTIAVQASIWTQPITRTTTALKESMKLSGSKSSMKFIPYVKEGVKESPRGKKAKKGIISPRVKSGKPKLTPRSNTTLESKTKTDSSLARSRTTIETTSPGRKSQLNHIAKQKSSISPRDRFADKLSEIKALSVEHFAYEFEKQFPFPLEGNPTEFQNTSENTQKEELETTHRGDSETTQKEESKIIPVEDAKTTQSKELETAQMEESQTTEKEASVQKVEVIEEIHVPQVVVFQMNEEKGGTEVQEKDDATVPLKNSKQGSPRNLSKREHTRTSLVSRPTSSDVIIGLHTLHLPPPRKARSEGNCRSRSTLQYSYNSPYALTDAQKEYVFKKGAWIRTQIRRKKKEKEHVEDMRRLENQRAFDDWIKAKKQSVKLIKKRMSKTTIGPRKVYSERGHSASHSGDESRANSGKRQHHKTLVRSME